MIAMTKIHVYNEYDDNKSRRVITFKMIFSILNFTIRLQNGFSPPLESISKCLSVEFYIGAN